MTVWIKRIHMYTGLLSCSALAIFGVVGIAASLLPPPRSRPAPEATVEYREFQIPGGMDDRELADLLDAVGDDGEPENSGRNGMCNIGLGLAMYRAIESGERFAFEAGLPVAVDDDYQYRGPNTVL